MKTFCLLLAALLIFGCAATLLDLRQSPPRFTLVSEQSPKNLANSIAYESQLGLDYWGCSWNPAQVTELNGTFIILVTLSSGLFAMTTAPIAEITIKPSNNGGSYLEYRSASIRGPCKDKFWHSVVIKCAGHEQTSQNIPAK